MNPWAIQSLVTSIFNIILGTYVLFKGPRMLLNRVFSLFAFSLAVWGLSEFGHRIVDSPEVAYLWMRAGGIGWCFMASLYLHFVLLLTRNENFLDRKYIYAFLYLPAIIFLHLFLTTDLIYEQEVVKRSWGYTSIPGSIAWVFFLYYFLAYLLTIYSIVGIEKKASTLVRRQAKPILMGTTVFLVTATATNIAFPVLNIQLPEFGSSLSIILTICTLYAILKHKLFTVELGPEDTKETKQKHILERGLSYSIKEVRLDKSYEIFADQLLNGSYGLCLSKLHPEKVRESYGLTRTPIVWVTFKENDNTVSPKDLDALESVISYFLNEALQPVILIDCFDEIRLTNGIDRAIDWLEKIRRSCEEKNCILLISVNPDTLEEGEVAMMGTCQCQ